MKPFPLPTYTVESGLRWIARLLAIFLVGLVLLFYIGEGFNPLKLTLLETVQHFFFFTT